MYLCHVFDIIAFQGEGDSREVLLGMKKRGFGTGKWNGFGGKVTHHIHMYCICTCLS